VLPTLKARRFEYQSGFGTRVDQTVNDDQFLQKVKNLKGKMIYLNSTVARQKFKELDVKKNHLWIMLLNSTIPANLTVF